MDIGLHVLVCDAAQNIPDGDTGQIIRLGTVHEPVVVETHASHGRKRRKTSGGDGMGCNPPSVL